MNWNWLCMNASNNSVANWMLMHLSAPELFLSLTKISKEECLRINWKFTAKEACYLSDLERTGKFTSTKNTSIFQWKKKKNRRIRN